jgi:hypothetical protein
VMQPILQGRSLRLHAAVVLLAVTAGGTLFGIAGAFLSVPVAAAGAVVLRYLSERIDARAGGETAPGVDPPLESLQTVLSVPNAPSPDGSVPDPDAPEPGGPATHIPDPAPEDQDGSNRDGSPEADTDAAKRDDPRH